MMNAIAIEINYWYSFEYMVKVMGWRWRRRGAAGRLVLVSYDSGILF
jgi:hypothetical protein